LLLDAVVEDTTVKVSSREYVLEEDNEREYDESLVS